MNFILSRTHTLSSALGHSVGFEKGVPTFVPPELYQEVQAIGAVPEEELPEPSTVSTAPTVPAEREKALFAAFEAILLRGKKEELTGSGVPREAVVEAALGWKLPPKEREAAWARFAAQHAE